MNQRGSTLAIIAIILLVLFLFVGLNMPGVLMTLMINSLVGLLLIIIINFLPQIQIPINIWTVLIAALGGLPGVLLLVILDLMKVKLE